jgi:ribosome biogenesis ATPase
MGIVLHTNLVLWHSGRRSVIERTTTPHGDIGTFRHRHQLAHKEQSLSRVSQGPNALNKSMQGLWQRRKVNLNATTQTVSSTTSATTPAPPPPAPPTSTSTPSDEPPPARPEPVPSPASGAVDGTPPTSSQSKRKLRSTRGDEGNKRSRTGTGSTSKEHAPPTVRLSDLGGVDPCVEKMLELVAMPLTHPEVYLHTGVQPPRGVLLYGPPGCGKTMLANAIGGVRCAPFGPFFLARQRGRADDVVG